MAHPPTLPSSLLDIFQRRSRLAFRATSDLRSRGREDTVGLHERAVERKAPPGASQRNASGSVVLGIYSLFG